MITWEVIAIVFYRLNIPNFIGPLLLWWRSNKLINNSHIKYDWVDISRVVMSTLESNFSLICLSSYTYKAVVTQHSVYLVPELEIVNRNFGWHSSTTLFWRPLLKCIYYIYTEYIYYALFNRCTAAIEFLPVFLFLAVGSKFTLSFLAYISLPYSFIHLLYIDKIDNEIQRDIYHKTCTVFIGNIYWSTL